MSENANKTRKPRPRLTLNFSDEDGDVPRHVWDELLNAVVADEGPHKMAHALCHTALESWAWTHADQRKMRETEAAAEAEAIDNAVTLSTMDDKTKLASVDDEEALVVRLREIRPGYAWVDRATAQMVNKRIDQEADA